MVLNLRIMKRLARYPTRSCRKKIGPGDTSLIHIARKNMRGSQKGRVSKMQAMSRTRFQDGTSEEDIAAFPLSKRVVRLLSGEAGVSSKETGPLPNCENGVCASFATKESWQTRPLEAERSTNETEGPELSSTVCILLARCCLDGKSRRINGN